MNLPVPVVGQEAGPQYATDINSCMSILDSHTHVPGSGVQITPDGMNINSDLSMGSNDLTSTKTINFTAQVSSLPGASPDLGCIYVAGVDLYYNDESGNVIQITQNGGVAGSNGSISNLVPPASASYVSGTDSFVWQSNANTAANMDNGAVTIREVAANANGVTIESPTSLAADYTITLLTALPATNLPISINNSGQLSAAQIVTTQIADSNVTTAKIANSNVTRPKLAPLGQQYGTGSGVSPVTNGTSFAAIGGDVTITSTGRPIYVGLVQNNSTTTGAYIQNTSAFCEIQFLRDSVTITEMSFGTDIAATPTRYPPSGFFMIDDTTGGAGTYVYRIQARAISGSVIWNNLRVIAYEMA